MDELLALVMHSRNLDGLAQLERRLFGNAIVGAIAHNHRRHVLRQFEHVLLHVSLGRLAHGGIGMNGLAQVVKTLGNALDINRSARLTAVNAKEHQILNENLDAQSHKVHRLDAHTVVKNDVSVLLDGCLDVRRERNCSHIVCAHVIERRNRIGRVAALGDGDVERVLRICVLKIDEGLGRHNGHLHLQRILQVIAGAIGGMARRTRSNDAQCVKRTGLENINELRYQLGRTLEVLTHTHVGKLNVIEHLHRLTS